MNPDFDREQEDTPRESNLMHILRSWYRMVWQNRRRVIIFEGVVGVIAVVVALLLPEIYTSRATLLPPDPQSGLSSMIGQMNLPISLPGNLSGGRPADLYPVIAKSRTVLESVLNRSYQGDTTYYDVFTEGEKLSPKKREYLLRSIRQQLRGEVDMTTNHIVLRFDHTDPEFAASFLTRIIDRMGDYLQNSVKSEGRMQRIMIEQRLEEVKDSLRMAEENLGAFLESNRTLSSPGLQIQAGRLRRQVEIYNQIFIELRKQHEVAKIQEINDMPILNVLDPPDVPHIRTSPERKKLVLGYLVLGFLLISLYLWKEEQILHLWRQRPGRKRRPERRDGEGEENA